MTERETKLENDIIRISHAMDVLADLFRKQRQDGEQIKIEYERRLEEVNKVINILLSLKRSTQQQAGEEGTNNMMVDSDALDSILNNGIEIMEREDGKKFALIPVVEEKPVYPPTAGQGSNAQQNRHTSQTGGRRQKKNKIRCSYCNEIGHTRAHCERRLLTPRGVNRSESGS